MMSLLKVLIHGSVQTVQYLHVCVAFVQAYLEAQSDCSCYLEISSTAFGQRFIVPQKGTFCWHGIPKWVLRKPVSNKCCFAPMDSLQLSSLWSSWWRKIWELLTQMKPPSTRVCSCLPSFASSSPERQKTGLSSGCSMWRGTTATK